MSKGWKKDVVKSVEPLSLAALLLLMGSVVAVVVSLALLTIVQMWGLL